MPLRPNLPPRPNMSFCPRCHKPKGHNDIICPNCGTRSCPKGHILSSRICSRCGWEDFSFKQYSRSGSTGSGNLAAPENTTHTIEYECPLCGTPAVDKYMKCPNRNCGYLGPHRYRKTHDKAQLLNTGIPGTPSATSRHYPVQSEPQQIPQAELSSQLKESASKDWLRSKKLLEQSAPVSEKATEKPRKDWEAQPEKNSKVKVLVIAGVIALIIIGAGVFSWGINLNAPKTTSPTITKPQPQPQPTPSKPPPVAVTPLTISNISVSNVTESSAVITWITNEPATTQLEYGTTNSYGKTADLSGALVTSHKVQLSSLNPSTTYYYKIVSKNASGKTAVSLADGTFVTAAPSDTTAPVITEINVLDVSDTTATIAWTTNEKSTTQVEYGTSASYGSTTPIDESLVTSHSITISGLESDKIYYFRVKSRDASKNEAVSSGNQTFKTLPPIPTGPAVGKRAPDFTVYTLNGDPITLSKLRGKIVMVNFWAVGCAPCVAEMPDIEAVYKTWSGTKEFKLLAINAGDYPIHIENFIKKENLTMPIFIDSDRTAVKEYQISSIPRTFFIDSSGIIRKIEFGRFDDQNQIRDALNSLQ